MRRLLPKSLIGQLALLMAAALLVAQAINFTLVLNERQRAGRAHAEGPAVHRFVLSAQRLAAMSAPERAAASPGRIRRGRISVGTDALLEPGSADPELTERLRDSAVANGLALRDARAGVSDEVRVPQRWRDEVPAGGEEEFERRMRELRTLLLSVQLPDGQWVNARVLTPRPDPWLAWRAAAATLLTYLIILGAMLWLALRMARPLRALTEAAERFQGRGEAPQVEPAGPADLRQAILAFNRMSARVSAMLDEKDRMLGAIGHDLRTPLASLRIRAETVEPEEERLRMIATIEEMTALLDDTLALARSGRAVEMPRAVDLTALADTVVEEFRELGHEVSLAPGERLCGKVQPRLLRRAVRNLVENGVKYAGHAEVTVRRAGTTIVIEVADEGPGIPAQRLESVQDPFVRIEESRSRETGGSGLGLTLARAAAQAHGGRLELENRAGGGLVARILLPAEAAAA